MEEKPDFYIDWCLYKVKVYIDNDDLKDESREITHHLIARNFDDAVNYARQWNSKDQVIGVWEMDTIILVPSKIDERRSA